MEGHSYEHDSHEEGVPSQFDIGEAAEGGAYVVADEPSRDEPAPSTLIDSQPEGHVGEPDDGLEGDAPDEADPDRARAASMRAAKSKLRVAANSANARRLPFIPDVAGRPRILGEQVGAPPKRRLPPRTCPQRWLRGCRICLQWRVLKHVLACLFLPTLTVLGLILHMHMPSNISFAESLLRGDLTTVKWYLDTEKMPLNSALIGDDQRRAPIHFAALGNQTTLVKHLVVRGALLDVQDANGFTALHYASTSENFELTDFLVSQGAPVDARDVNERTPLHIAAIAGSVPVLAVLVFNGHADLKAVDKDDYRATDYSRLFHSSSLHRLLDGGYYHDAQGEMKVIAHHKFEAMRTREGIATDTGGQGNSEKKRKKKKRSRKQKSASIPTLQAKEDRASPHAPTPDTSAVDEEDDFMTLFTGDADVTLTTARYKRATAAAAIEAAQQWEAASDFDTLRRAGEVDRDEFDV
jgi:hypothetical protein